MKMSLQQLGHCTKRLPDGYCSLACGVEGARFFGEEVVFDFLADACGVGELVDVEGEFAEFLRLEDFGNAGDGLDGAAGNEF